MSTLRVAHDIYTVGWICALPLEAAAARALLDKDHPRLPQPTGDDNIYSLGEISGQNVVIACLPSGVYGTTSAATVAARMRFTFPSIRYNLMVGIGGGVPSLNHDIRLGDIVISHPTTKYGGVIQYDHGKTVSRGHLQQTGIMNQPPPVLLNAISQLRANEMMGCSPSIHDMVSEVLTNQVGMRSQYARPSADRDLLFKAAYDHNPAQNTTCVECDRDELIKRDPRASVEPHIYYGLIASGNQVMKHGLTRDKLANEFGIMCFEMEAAGLMNQFPCLVIRGICDYSDSHKNKQWSGYAALTAAAYTKVLLSAVPVTEPPYSTMIPSQSPLELLGTALSDPEDLHLCQPTDRDPDKPNNNTHGMADPTLDCAIGERSDLTGQGGTVVTDRDAEQSPTILEKGWSTSDTSYEARTWQKMTEENKKSAWKNHMLSQLYFPSLDSRMQDISKAHEATLKWIYKSPHNDSHLWDNFSAWLSKGGGIYWVQGKPGSGKSCLMKYLHASERTKVLLSEWAGNQTLVIASFFFWHQGTADQKSLDGLLRSLLYKILREHPVLIPVAYPTAWRRYRETGLTDGFTMSSSALNVGVSRVLLQQAFCLKVCLLIDGLDEYAGDYVEIVKLFKDVSSSPNTKICVSSRQWPIFQNAFKSCPGLILQNLTRKDISNYTDQELGREPRMLRLQRSDPENALYFSQEIAERSFGVFLWVKLVVRSLLTGLMNNDGIPDLMQRLVELPTDLERLYIFLLNRIDYTYLKEALILLQIIHQAQRPLSSFQVAIADSYYVVAQPTAYGVISADSIGDVSRIVEEKIQSRCLGLLECTNVQKPIQNRESLAQLAGCPTQVQVMHRTVTDFFDKPENWEELRVRLKEPLQDANAALCYSSLFMLKNIFTSTLYGSWASSSPTFKTLVQECVHYAAQAEQGPSHEVQTVFLDSLFETANSQYYQALRIPEMNFSTTTTTWVHTLLPRAAQRKTEAMFLALAIEHGAVGYVAMKLSAGEHDILQDDLQFLLGYTLRARIKRPRMVKLLLSYGADPNGSSFGSSPWLYLLKYAWSTLGQLGQVDSGPIMTESGQTLIETMEYMMNFDVDPNQVCTISEGRNGAGSEESALALTIFIRMRNPRLVRLLLEKGADPNRVHKGQTPWQDALSCLYVCHLNIIFVEGPTLVKFVSDWLGIYKLLLKNGADPHTMVVVKKGFLVRHVSVLTIIRDVFSELDEAGACHLSSLVPADVKPADVKPADVKPVDVKPVDVKPERREPRLHIGPGVRVAENTRPISWSRLRGLFKSREASR